MKSNHQHGLDYTPLFRFLLSRVGQKWTVVYSEAVARLDKSTPISWMVNSEFDPEDTHFRAGENSYYSKLYVDRAGILQFSNSLINETTLKPSCACCTHTFNGKVFTTKFNFDYQYVDLSIHGQGVKAEFANETFLETREFANDRDA